MIFTHKQNTHTYLQNGKTNCINNKTKTHTKCAYFIFGKLSEIIDRRFDIWTTQKKIKNKRMHIEYSARAHTIFIGRDEIEDHGLLSDRFKFELNEFLVLADR